MRLKCVKVKVRSGKLQFTIKNTQQLCNTFYNVSMVTCLVPGYIVHWIVCFCFSELKTMNLSHTAWWPWQSHQRSKLKNTVFLTSFFTPKLFVWLPNCLYIKRWSSIFLCGMFKKKVKTHYPVYAKDVCYNCYSSLWKQYTILILGMGLK